MVANKVTGHTDADRIGRQLGRTVVAAVPADAGVADADRRAAAPLDAAPDGPLVSAVVELADAVLSLYPLEQVPERLGRRKIG